METDKKLHLSTKYRSAGYDSRIIRAKFLLPFFTLAFSFRILEDLTAGRNDFRALYEAGISGVFFQINYAQVALQSFYDTALFLLLILTVSYFPKFWNRLHEVFLGINERIYLPVVFIFSALYSVGEFYKIRFIPFRGDDFAFMFQARLLSMGKLFLAPHPLQKFFLTDYIIHNTGKVYAEYTLGTPLFLMFGELLGFPWLVNPILGAVSLILIYYLIKELFSVEIARYGVIAIAASPYFLLGTASYLSHVPSLFCLSLFFLLLLKARKSNKKYYYISAGLMIGLGFHIRILTSLFLVSLVLSWWLGEALLKFKKGKTRLTEHLLFPILYMGAGFILPFGLLLLVNYLQNGQPFLFGHQVYNGPGKTIGFSAEYPPREALLAAVYRLKIILGDLFKARHLSVIGIWGLGASLLLLRNKYRYLLLCALAGMFIVYLPVVSAYSQTRYYFIPFVYFIPLIGVGLDRFVGYSENYSLNRSTVFPLFTLIILLYCGSSFSLKPYSYYRAFARPRDLMKERGIHNAVVFIRSTRQYYPKWHVRNSPFIDDDVLFALDLGEENQELLDYYPDRSFYYLDNKSLTDYHTGIEKAVPNP